MILQIKMNKIKDNRTETGNPAFLYDTIPIYSPIYFIKKSLHNFIFNQRELLSGSVLVDT